MTTAGSSRTGRVALRWVTAVSVALSLMVAVAPAEAATAKTSHLRSAAVPATVLINAPLTIAGAVSPGVKGKPVYLQRLTAGKWVSIGHVPSGKLGVYSFTVKAKGHAGVWSLRVIRPANSVAKAVVGKTMKVRLTKTAYKVTLAAVTKVNAGDPLVISGVVTPKTSGQVVLQYVKKGKWATLATGRLSGSAYSFTKVVPADGYKLRVIKPFDTTIAGGVSRSVTVTVFPKPTLPPTVGVTSPDQSILGLSAQRLVFSTVLSAATPPKSFTFTNTGKASVTISGLAIQGADASSYSLVPGQATTVTVPAGGSTAIGVQFNPTPTTGCPVSDPAGNPHEYDIGNAVRIAGLVFSSTDKGLPGGAVALGGINSCNYDGDNEPVLDQVLTALGYTDVVDTPKGNRRFIGPVANLPGTDEITAPYFSVADPTQPVSIVPLAHYSTTSVNPYQPTGWYAKGDPIGPDGTCNASCHQVWIFPGEPAAPTSFLQNQRLLPTPTGATTFTPTGVFGIYNGSSTNVNFTDDSFNIAHMCTATASSTCGYDGADIVPAQVLHNIRVYPAYGANHVAVPHTYLLAVDVSRLRDKNNDFQDVVMVLSNVVPAS